MKLFFVIIPKDHDDLVSHVFGVFSTYAKADAYIINKMFRSENGVCDDMQIKEIYIDEEIDW